MHAFTDAISPVQLDYLEKSHAKVGFIRSAYMREVGALMAKVIGARKGVPWKWVRGYRRLVGQVPVDQPDDIALRPKARVRPSSKPLVSTPSLLHTSGTDIWSRRPSRASPRLISCRRARASAATTRASRA